MRVNGASIVGNKFSFYGLVIVYSTRIGFEGRCNVKYSLFCVRGRRGVEERWWRKVAGNLFDTTNSKTAALSIFNEYHISKSGEGVTEWMKWDELQGWISPHFSWLQGWCLKHCMFHCCSFAHFWYSIPARIASDWNNKFLMIFSNDTNESFILALL